MTSDLELARRSRLRGARRSERERWLAQLSIVVEVTWPRGVLGRVCGVLLLLTPAAIIVIVAALAAWLRRRSIARSGGPNGDAA